MKNLPSIILIVTLGLFVAAIVSFGAWSSPIANPPACPPGAPGCEAPLTIGNVFQSKRGSLAVQGWTEAHGGIKVGPGPISSYWNCPSGLSNSPGTGCTPLNVKLDVRGGGLDVYGEIKGLGTPIYSCPIISCSYLGVSWSSGCFGQLTTLGYCLAISRQCWWTWDDAWTSCGAPIGRIIKK